MAVTREQLIAAFPGLSPRGNLRSYIPGSIGNMFFQQASIAEADILDVYGSPDEFLAKYQEFQDKYFAALETNLGGKRNRILVEHYKKNSIIDLGLLDRQARRDLEGFFKNDVMKLQKLIDRVGLPSIQMPSANLYRGVFKFEVDNRDGILHPVQTILNSINMSFNPEGGTGVSTLSLGSRNILGVKAVQNMWTKMRQHVNAAGVADIQKQMDPFQGLNVGQRVATLDIESTGVSRISQVRSAAVSVMQVNSNGILEAAPSENVHIGFRSPQLHGYNVRNVNGVLSTLNDHILGIEFSSPGAGLNRTFDIGPGGVTFLDEASDVLQKLLDADRLAGHNVHFDITMLTRSMMAQESFGQHDRAGRLIGQLYKRIDDEPDYLVDTLTSARVYLAKQAQDVVDQLGSADARVRSDKYLQTIMAEATQAKVHLGGSATYADVSNIALNTNLFELIEKEGQADELFRLINKGSHVAETDVFLQGYITKFIQEGSLKLRAQYDPKADIDTDLGSFARRQVSKSHAINMSTNMASVEHISQTLFNQIIDETPGQGGIRGVKLQGTLSELGLTVQGISQDTSGILQFHSESNKFVFSTANGITDVRDTDAVRTIKNILTRARQDFETGTTTPQRIVTSTGQTLTGARNAHNDLILTLGRSYGSASRIDELEHIGTVVSGQPVSKQNILDTLGSVYTEFGVPLQKADKVAVGRGTTVPELILSKGIRDFTLTQSKQMAEAFAAIGDRYAGVLDVRSRTVSTALASSTVDVAREAVRAAELSGADPNKIAHAVHADKLAEFGFSYFRSQDKLRIFDVTKSDSLIRSKPMIQQKVLDVVFGTDTPLDVNGNVDITQFSDSQLERLQRLSGATQDQLDALQRLSDTQRKVGFSIVDHETAPIRLNAVWNIGEQLGDADMQLVSESLLDITANEHSMARALGKTIEDVRGDADLQKQIAMAKTLRNPTGKQTVIRNLASFIRERGIVIGYNEGSVAERQIDVLNAAGLLNETDVGMTQRAVVQQSALTDDYMVAGPLIDEDEARIAGKLTEYRTASAVGADGVSEALSSTNKIAAELESDPDLLARVTSRTRNPRIGSEVNHLTTFYAANKKKLAIGALAVAGVGLAINRLKKRKEQNVIEETVEQQPYQDSSTVQQMQKNDNMVYYNGPNVSDPLASAGVVGRLDRMAIGHTRMGNDRYNHLYGES